MMVNARTVLLAGAKSRMDYATMLLEPVAPEYTLKRLVLALRVMGDAAELLRIAAGKS